MKRLLSSVIVLFVMLSCVISCYAAECEKVYTGNIYGKYNYYSNSDFYVAESNGEFYEAITDNGVTITINTILTDNFTVIVHQISQDEKDCYEWIASCISHDFVNFTAYDIYCLNTSGERVELPTNAEITISPISLIDSVLWLSYDGEASTISHIVNEQKLTFKTVGNGGYYLLCKDTAELQSPQTGNAMIMYPWLFLMMISLVVLAITSRKLYSQKY